MEPEVGWVLGATTIERSELDVAVTVILYVALFFKHEEVSQLSNDLKLEMSEFSIKSAAGPPLVTPYTTF